MKLVAEQAAANKLHRGAVRFTRRELRESLGWDDTQLKVHLGRLVDLELAVVGLEKPALHRLQVNQQVLAGQ